MTGTVQNCLGTKQDQLWQILPGISRVACAVCILTSSAGGLIARVVLGVFVVGGTEPVTSAAFVAVSHTAWPTTCTPVSIQVYSVSGQGFAPFYFPFLFLEERYFLFTFKKRKILPPDVLSRNGMSICWRKS